MVEPADKIQKNKDIAKAAAAYNRLPLTQKTKANAKIIFDYLNTNQTGASKISLDNLDEMDQYFKDVMGFSPLKNSVSEEEFYQNIGLWAESFAAYKPKEPKPVIPYSSATQNTIIATNLKKALTPDGGFSRWGDFWGNDDVRAKAAYAMFGSQANQINVNNIIEVLDASNLGDIRTGCYYLDNDDEVALVKLFVAHVRDRADLLKKNGIELDYAAVDQYLKNVNTRANVDDRNNFSFWMGKCVDMMRGVGVGKPQ